MARTASGCLGSIAMCVGDAGRRLQTRTDRIFLLFATFAHLCISVLGTVTLVARAAEAGEGGPNLADPSTLLFLLAGATAAMLLLHASRSEISPPAIEERHRRIREVFDGPGIPVGRRTVGNAPAAGGVTPIFTGLMDSVGHEIRTPLNAIIGFSDLMQRELLGPLGSPRYREYVRHIRESGLAVLKAAEDTMALTALLAERGPARCAAVDLDSLLADVCRQSDAHGRGIRVVRDPAFGATVCAEPRALRQSLANLISAAAGRAARNRPVAITTRVVGASVRLCVSFTDNRSKEHTRRQGEHARSRGPGTAHGSIAVARMLFELQGIRLVETRGRDGTRRMRAELPLAEAPHRRAGSRTRPGTRMETGSLFAH